MLIPFASPDGGRRVYADDQRMAAMAEEIGLLVLCSLVSLSF